MLLELYIVGTIATLMATAIGTEYIQLGKHKWTRWIGALLWPILLPFSILALLINVGLLSERVAKTMGMEIVKR